jgi:hypothetical protein
LLVALTRPAAAPWGDAWPLIASFGVVAVVGLPAVLAATAGYVRADALDSLPARPVAGGRLTLADDIAAIVPRLGRPVRAALQRPGLTCAAIAVTAFAAVVTLQTFVVASLVLGAFEATAIVIGYVTLGRPLGLRNG